MADGKLLTIALVTIGGFVGTLWMNPDLLSGSAAATRVFITLTFGAGIFIVAFMCLIILASDRKNTDSEEKFDSAKEIFTALVAVFGTIIGFYFGTSQSNTETRSPMEIGLIVGLSGLGINVADIPDNQLGAIGSIYFSTQDDNVKAQEIKRLLGIDAPDANKKGSTDPYPPASDETEKSGDV